MQYFAHQGQTLNSHLQNVSDLAFSFGESFGLGEESKQVGSVHDIGKATPTFQAHLNGSSVIVDHSLAGAKVLIALKDYEGAFAVAGHHTGLEDIGTRCDDSHKGTLLGRLNTLNEIPELQGLSIPSEKVSVPACFTDNKFSRSFMTRMLYSCLVDADFLDTENFMTKTVRKPCGSVLDNKAKLDKKMQEWSESAVSELDKTRCKIAAAARSHASDKQGIFTMTTPTGGGKTTASMSFAMDHAEAHPNIKHIIYVIPYCSIIDQTVSVFENILGKDSVLAHYSEANTSDPENQLATENWDAPIIITTAVQFFESVYGNRVSKCRKLHNIANSIIVFDEAQMLPMEYLRPCVRAIEELVRNYGCSAVLCTATQPAIEDLFQKNTVFTELCPAEYANAPIFQRVRFVQEPGVLNYKEIAGKLMQERQVLCIVNTKADAQKIYQELSGPNTYCLTRAMTPAERSQIIDKIKHKSETDICRVIATSLVEAGVDVDFPCVYKAYAGLDSILQAAGRCNREGKYLLGTVHIIRVDGSAFIPKETMLRISATEMTLRDMEDLNDADTAKALVSAYFTNLRNFICGQEKTDAEHIIADCEAFKFKTVADHFQIIKEDSALVYIPNKNNQDLISKIGTEQETRNLWRELGKDSISVSIGMLAKLKKQGSVQMLSENTCLLTDSVVYKPGFGLAY